LIERVPGKDFSIIVSTQNCKDDIDRCLESIASQRDVNYEILVVDGVSTDGTWEKILGWSDYISWRCSEPDEGIYDAWNKAITRSSGKWLCFLGADDMLHSEYVLANAKINLDKLEGTAARLVYSKTNLVDRSSGVVKRVLGDSARNIQWQFRHGMPIEVSHTGMFHHHSIFAKYGNFDPEFRIAGDYEKIVATLKEEPNALAYLEDLVVADKGIGGIADRNRLIAIKECRLARIKNGLRGTTFIWLIIYCRALLRDKIARLGYDN
jgi:glycosyltransferase involved in cell wall biosynthesis